VPLYEYKCLKCGRKTEKIETVSGPHLKKCPHCGGKVESVITAPSIQFKGTGWYVTDYAGKSAVKTTGGAEGSSSDGKDSGGKEGAAKDSVAKESAPKETPAKEKKAEKKK
jgi:putative FmdB family regulatory protein